ncbi:hypothetical protein APV47_12800 [Staphylococcus aureus]|uniref:Uncharacterized protein n=2 Tax=Staphylococcus TaxID=1279 RepID=A0A0D4ZYS4_STAEP|nr:MULTISPECIES: hypothetical protein [Staphylococcus]MDY3360370.1 hypothetical protein [Clostridium celatum]AJW29180.1 hypothetical protein [Staphylococcus epidermidis]ARA73651.1 hypothetical protein [Staphylococcus epidermidis]KZG49424.1 hypothetical protein A4U44_00415 [Staphylococcus epidermidis]KZG55041.1 hypothetical protein A0W31_03840 [Staphylococcus epidermidis]
MKKDYDTKLWYEVDVSNFDVKKELQNMDLYKHEYVKLINDKWIDVLDKIYRSIGDFGESPQDTLQTFSVYRGNTAGNKYIYDIGFNVDLARDLIKKTNRKPLKAPNDIFNDGIHIDYTERENPYTLTLDEPIILIPDLVTSREARFKEIYDIPTSLLVLDGNNRVTLMKKDNQPYIHCYYVSLDELLENKVFLTEFDSAVYCQMADLVYILKHIDEPNINEIAKLYYNQSYLVNHFSKYIK